MVRHIVMFKLRSAFSPAEIPYKAAVVKRRIENLKEEIPFIRELEVGININQVPWAYDVVLSSEFDNMDDLERYRVHPAHQAFIEFNKGYSEAKVSVDYEI